jgi:hypothetical protein
VLAGLFVGELVDFEVGFLLSEDVGATVGLDIGYGLPDETQTPELSSHIHKVSLLHFLFFANDGQFERLVTVGAPVGWRVGDVASAT